LVLLYGKQSKMKVLEPVKDVDAAGLMSEKTVEPLHDCRGYTDGTKESLLESSPRAPFQAGKGTLRPGAGRVGLETVYRVKDVQ
jgi:hypothetical protein